MTRLALPPQNEELISLVDSISLAADSLSNTIDDLVDFNALNGTILHGAGVKVTDSTMTATVLDIFGTISDAAVAQYTHRRRVLRQSDLAEIQKPINLDLPPPELFIKLSPISNAALKKVDIDVEALRRIVSKVVSNALRATETGIITVSAAISAVDADSPTPEMGPFRRKSRKKASELEIVISDTGKGMTDKFLKARLFEPFSQEDPFWSGTGLSLTLCRNMIDELGGRVQVSSVVGEGTDFFIHVPLPGGIAETPSKRSLSSPRSATPAYFLRFDDEERFGHRTYRSHLIRQFDLRPVEEAQVGQARVIFVISEALEDGSALAVLEGKLGRLKNKASTSSQGPLLVVLSAFGFTDDPEQGNSLARLAEAEQCELLILERPFGVKGILLLDDKLRTIGDAEREGRGELMQKAGMLVTGALDVNGRRSPNMRTSAEFRVLVVEDNPLNARILTTMLRKIGVGFHEATNGREAVDMYRKYSHDVVLMDISMPEMDGFEACEKIKAMDGSEGSRIIAITALSSELDRIRGREVGFSEWIVKPVRLGPLAQDVKKWKEDADASRILEWKENTEASLIVGVDQEMAVYA
ncbi:unnamed protein product [Tilletia controversa]|uniref:histidine kinase n=1 Tax=Tilletia controversa TaxID=13291 RepID=A0A8X7STU0_9BASI|nr:hypothetical protein CF328_g6462 [Tilletia controversa]KAE8242005.1 hypothetical protein A4X06_0g7311 [Tilletia controversa]CAD6896590.1 unnamed protein product [Tilletia controversa]CAD6966948.1 unnamed protein product [Tilletia controversa]